ncbi:NACHT domain-containing protein [Thermodesulfovibrio thiophilus]|uniref:NACHT domain-containing protein n=1 Tax=Thermodesulfovibrio thiophilus TaxID=340095 RepID=UPI0003F7C1F4|nr:hypothetical protein [Thermodesulfovibrio thiophilus]
MFKIDWHQFEKNAEGSPQKFFEKFIYQIAVQKYQSFGLIKYFYNTPGSEFYLILNKDCELENISLKAGDAVGWQAKFWFNRSDPENSPLDSGKRDELVKEFKKSLEYEPNLKIWIICTPGLFSNTKTSSGIKPFEELEKALKLIKADIKLILWNKPMLESFAHAEPEKYGSIFNYYCSTNFLSFKLFEAHSRKRLNILQKRYDTDLYVPGEIDREILSSIFYKDLIGKLHNKIKHALEEKEKLVRGHLYRVVIDRFLNSQGAPEISDKEKEKIRKQKKLIDAFLSLYNKLHSYEEQENTLTFIKSLLDTFDSNKDEIITLINELGLPERFYDLEDIDINYELDIQHTWGLINYLYTLAENLLKNIIKIYKLINNISRQVFHVFAEAGFGKTNLACYLTEQLLKKRAPVILIPASEINGGDSIQNQIASFLGINVSNNFVNFIGILDSIGFHYGIKIPIIIDGLNETQPSASAWYPQLQYIIDDIKKFSNVMLITTCRNAYAKQIFGEEHIENIPNFIKLEGFKNNIKEAISKYFRKYEITVKNKDYNRELLNNPLLLKIFSQANKGKTIEINEISIYPAIDSYITEIIESVSIQHGEINPLRKNQVLKGIKNYSLHLWNNKIRGTAYPDEIIKLFDPDYNINKDWHDTVTYKIIDEGMLFRNIHDNIEFVEFTHDLIGGYCIAKYVFFDDKNEDEIIRNITSIDNILKLTSEEAIGRHPLAEDILKAIVYLTPEHTGKQLFELTNNQEILKASLREIRIIISKPKGVESLIKKFKSISPDSTILSTLLENLINEILRSDENIILSELLEEILLKLTLVQIDLSWSEIIRRKSDRIISYLHQIIELFESGKECKDHINWRLCFIGLLLSSTNRYLRDLATKTLVIIGRKYPETLVDVFIRLEGTPDLFILERLIASICGVFLTIDNKELLFRVCKHLEKNYIEQIRTTHVLILDYIITLLNYAEKFFNYTPSLRRLKANGLIDWQKDTECLTKVTDPTWGFGPVEYDFAKYKIGTYLAQYRHKENSKLPTLKEALAMVVWRIKELGYTKELFEEVDRSLNNQEHKKYGYGSPYSATTYSKKYRDIAFYELYGYNIIKGISKDFKDEEGFRVLPTYIDPTFPKISSKRQLITCCFLPKKSDDVQAWIINNESPFIEEHYIRRDIEKDNTEWVMLYGHLFQEGIEKSRIDISLYTIIVPRDSARRVIRKIEKNELDLFMLVSENHNVYGGEIPWSENYLDSTITNDMSGDNIELYLPVSYYSRETKSKIEVLHYAYIPSKRLALHFDLKINIDDFNLYEKNGKKASSYIHDNYSRFLYFRKDLIQQFLSNHRQSMLWIEIASKYGAYGEYENKYDPSFQDYRFIKCFS